MLDLRYFPPVPDKAAQTQSRVMVACRKPPINGMQPDPKLAPLQPLWTGLTVPLAPDPHQVRSTIVDAFPNLSEFADWIAGELRLQRLAAKRPVVLPPILLWGPPGAGKTFLARLLMEALSTPYHLVNLGGSADARTVLGTSAGYSTGQACLPAQIMARLETISPGLIADEIDKTHQGSANGSWIEGMLTMLEPVSSRSYFDEFLLTNVDISGVSWIATANSIANLPRPLLSRFACFEITGTAFPDSTSVLRAALKGLAQDLGLDADTLDALIDLKQHQARLSMQARTVRSAKAVLRALLGQVMLEQNVH